ncbi:DMT family transporter [filamentous cyanobacterium LEGE 11480]|uniref:DMT family transporter n=2 Tax=Romeriopsis TaxID=2992131 RepID=A0A928VPJ3_9CYAN|nr:DMT family transporter [Romeriopsis navalis LEGE 11480]
MMAIATAAIFIRCAVNTAGVSHPSFSLVIAASRMSLAALLLTPQFWLNQSSIPWHNHRAIAYAVGAGITLAIHFAAWVTSLSYTSIAASTVLVTTTPIWTTLTCRVYFKEAMSNWSILGLAIACSGSLRIATDHMQTASAADPMLGNSLALIGAVMATAYLLLGRCAQQNGLATSHYSLLAYSTAAIVLLPLPLLNGVSYFGYAPMTYGWFILLAIVPQLIGHTSFNWAIRHVSPSLVTLTILAEPIGASWLGYLIFQEIPTTQTLQGSGMILSGITIASLSAAKTTSE